MSAAFAAHAFMSIVGILPSRLARLQPPLWEGASLPLHTPIISHLFTLPQKPSPFFFQQGSLRDGRQGLGSFFSLPVCFLSLFCRRNRVTWRSGYVRPRKVYRSLKPKIFSYSAREGYSFHLNRGMKLLFRAELAILQKTKELYISMG